MSFRLKNKRPLRIKKELMNTQTSHEDMTDTVRGRAADSLESAAHSVRSAGDQAADSVRSAGRQSAAAINDLANDAGEKLDSTATTVRTFDMVSEMKRAVRHRPLEYLAVATAVGLIVGLSLRRSGQ